jgi:hypothetical protein
MSMCGLGRQTDRFAEGRMRMDRLANIYGIRPHLDRQGNFAN